MQRSGYSSTDATLNRVYHQASTYNRKSQLTEQVVEAVRTDGDWVWDTTYGFNNYTGNGLYNGDYTAAPAHEHTAITKDGVAQTPTDIWLSYTWDDAGAHESQEVYWPGASNTYTNFFVEDRRGFHTETDIHDGSPRDIVYAVNQNGQIVSSDTMNAADTANLTAPHSRFYYFDGVQVGDVSNNGTSDIDYVASIARNVAKPAGTGLFTNGATSGSSYADFDASYQPVISGDRIPIAALGDLLPLLCQHSRMKTPERLV